MYEFSLSTRFLLDFKSKKVSRKARSSKHRVKEEGEGTRSSSFCFLVFTLWESLSPFILVPGSSQQFKREFSGKKKVQMTFTISFHPFLCITNQPKRGREWIYWLMRDYVRQASIDPCPDSWIKRTLELCKWTTREGIEGVIHFR